MALAYVPCGYGLARVVSVGEFEVKTLRHLRQHSFHDELGESLAETRSFTTVEWQPGERIAFFTAWSLGERMPHVEAVREELERLLPLTRVVMKAPNVDQEHVISLYSQVSNLSVLLKE